MKTKHLIQLRKGDRFISGGHELLVCSDPEIRDGWIRFDVAGELGLPVPYKADTNWKVELVESSQAV